MDSGDMDSGDMDSGDMVSGDMDSQVGHDVAADDTESSLRQRSIEVGVPLFVKAVESLLLATAERTPQDHVVMRFFGFPPRGASQR